MVEIDGKGMSAFLQDYLFASRISDPYFASLTGALAYLLIWYVILRFFYQRGCIFKV
jgi:predicted acyltransferase